MKKYIPRAITYFSMPLMYLATLASNNFNSREFFSSEVHSGFRGGWFVYVFISLFLAYGRSQEYIAAAKFSDLKLLRISALLPLAVMGCCATIFIEDTFVAKFYAQTAVAMAYLCVEIYLSYYETNFEEIANRKASI